MNDLQSKTDEELNVMLAGLLGIDLSGFDTCQCGDSAESHRIGHNEHAFVPFEERPRYCTDLNAVAKVEAGLNGSQRVEYYYILEPIVCGKRPWKYDMIHAKPRQRTIALIHTLTP